MHILFFADNFPPEGNAIASRVFERARYWIKWGHEVTVITSTPNFPEGKVYPGYQNKWYQVETMAGIRVVRIKTFIAANKGMLLRTVDFLSFMLPAFMAGLWQKKPCVIAATTPQPFAALTAWFVAKIKRVPFLLEVADIWPASIVGVGAVKKRNLLINGLEKLELFLYQQARSIVVLTPAFKINLVERGIAAKKITTVINGVDLEQFRPLPPNHVLAQTHQIQAHQFVIGYIGTHGMAHALRNVIHAAEQLRHDPSILFLFVGAGAERDDLIATAQAKQLTNIHFIPAQAKQTIRHFWSLCHVALVHLKKDPVFAEVIPSKLFEAMGMGLPIVLAAPQGEASRIVINEQVGVWVPPEDPTALAHAIHTLYQQPSTRQQFADNSRRAASLYSRERQASEMLQVLSQCVAKQGVAA